MNILILLVSLLTVGTHASMSSSNLIAKIRCFSPHACQQDRIQVINKAPLLEVIIVKRAGHEAWLQVKNGYDKKIAALEIRKRPGGIGMTLDLVRSQRSIEPGAVFEFRVHLGNPSRFTEEELKQEPQIEIVVVMFEDGTSEGDLQGAIEIDGRHRAENIQMGRILALLQEAIESSNTNSSEVLERLKKEIAALSTDEGVEEVFRQSSLKYAITSEMNDSINGAIKSGFHGAKDVALYRVLEIERGLLLGGGAQLKERLSDVKEHFQKVFGGK
ncbi:MAG: hypothetical protein L0229_14580 [Blastocatellia bacterium]|nr:hypothetical protein [Blastocatellia bacterium]